MKQQTTYGKEAARHAKVLISQGWTNEEIRAVAVCKDIPAEKLRLWRFRMKSKKETANETPETLHETPETGYITGMSEQEQNHTLDAENDVLPVSKAFQPVSTRFVFLQFCKEFSTCFHPADLVFYAVVGIGCSGVVTALPGVGIAFSGVWFCIAALYLHRVKIWAKWYDIGMLAVFELLAGFVADWVWANNALWANIARLPFRVYVEKYQNGAGELVAFYAGKDVEMPAYVACYIAAMLVIFGGASVAVSTLANRKRINSQTK